MAKESTVSIHELEPAQSWCVQARDRHLLHFSFALDADELAVDRGNDLDRFAGECFDDATVADISAANADRARHFGVSFASAAASASTFAARALPRSIAWKSEFSMAALANLFVRFISVYV